MPTRREIVLWAACALAALAGSELERMGNGNYRFVMTPGLDQADRRQLTGCLQDLRIDNVLANVVSMTHTDGDRPTDDDHNDNGK